MSVRSSVVGVVSLLPWLLIAACSSDAAPGNGVGGISGVSGAPSGVAGSSATAGAPSSGTSGAAGSSSQGGGAQAGAGGVSAGAGGTAGAAVGTAGATGTAGTTGTAGGSGTGMDIPPSKTLTVDKACKCALGFSAVDADPNAGKSTTPTHPGDQSLYVDPTKKIQGKLVIVLGGINGGPGGGGIEGFAKLNGFHVFAVGTQTDQSSAPDSYKNTIKTTPMDPEANRQVGDARMEAWDGVDRVNWLSIQPPDSIATRTLMALKYGMLKAPGGGWDYYLTADGNGVRWSDVFMVGYSFGSQTIAMVSKYVRFGRVFCTSGPQDEGFPNATWIAQPSATPVDRLYMAVGFTNPYPSTNANDKEVTGMFQTVTSAGWIATPIVNVVPGGTGPFTGAHLLSMVGSDANSPGGHTVFCNDNSKSGWIPACTYAFDVK